MKYALLAIVTLLLPTISIATPAVDRDREAKKGQSQSALFLSDIHFDPLRDPELIDELLKTPVVEWKAVFRKSTLTRTPLIGRDTDYTLWMSALEAMKKSSAHPGVILIAGDFLVHHIREKFLDGQPSRDEAGFTTLVDKTIAFVALTLIEKFPETQIVPVLGNNDSYCGDYASAPRSTFLRSFAMTWKDVVTKNSSTFVKSFSENGYFSVRARKLRKTRFIALNSAYWSSQYKNRCGEGGDSKPGQGELQWFRRQLEASRRREEKVWVIHHIPMGIDLFATLKWNMRKSGTNTVSFLRYDSNQSLLKLMSEFPNTIALSVTGHSHMHELRTHGEAVGQSAPLIGVPAISGMFGNNPAFIVLNTTTRGDKIQDFRLWSLTNAQSDYVTGTSAWTPSPSFGETYGQPDASNESVRGVIDDLRTNSTSRSHYRAFYNSASPVNTPIFDDWRVYLCSITQMDLDRFEKCAMNNSNEFNPSP